MNKNKKYFSIKRKGSKKAALIAVISIVLLLLIGTAAAYYFELGPFKPTDSSVNLDEPTEEQKQTGNDIKQNSLDQVKDDDKAQAGSDPLPDAKPIDGSDKQSVNAEITTANQDESKLHIRTLIQTITNTGTCTLTMSGPSDAEYNESVGVQALPSSSTCKGFDIPLDQLSTGQWTMNIEFNNNDLVASTSKEIDIK